VVSAAARRMHTESAESAGKVRPSEALRARVATFLETRTWEQAMQTTGMSRRTLERMERGSFCDPGELEAMPIS
jgi:hypothetical protein